MTIGILHRELIFQAVPNVGSPLISIHFRWSFCGKWLKVPSCTPVCLWWLLWYKAHTCLSVTLSVSLSPCLSFLHTPTLCSPCHLVTIADQFLMKAAEALMWVETCKLWIKKFALIILLQTWWTFCVTKQLSWKLSPRKPLSWKLSPGKHLSWKLSHQNISEYFVQEAVTWKGFGKETVSCEMLTLITLPTDKLLSWKLWPKKVLSRKLLPFLFNVVIILLIYLF